MDIYNRFIRHEDFLGMYELEKTDAETITTSLKDILLRCNLTINDCRWQTYDGAANMAGSRNGVAARISSENPRALYIHCGDHTLDLALHDCVKESEIISDALKVAQDLAVFIRSSPTRMVQYQHTVSRKILTTTPRKLKIRICCVQLGGR